MIAFILFTACQLGLTPVNPEYLDVAFEEEYESEEEVYMDASAISHEEDEDELFTPEKDDSDQQWDPENSNADNNEEPDETEETEEIEETTETEEAEEFSPYNALDPNIDNDGDGFSINEGDCNDEDETIMPNQPDLGGDGIDNNCDGNDAYGGITCAYNIEMVCGLDGWVGHQLLINADGSSFTDWTQACQNNGQNWNPITSEMLDVQLSPGEVLELSLCDTNGNCSNLNARDSGLILKVNGTLIEYQDMIESNWMFMHTCPL